MRLCARLAVDRARSWQFLVGQFELDRTTHEGEPGPEAEQQQRTTHAQRTTHDDMSRPTRAAKGAKKEGGAGLAAAAPCPPPTAPAALPTHSTSAAFLAAASQPFDEQDDDVVALTNEFDQLRMWSSDVVSHARSVDRVFAENYSGSFANGDLRLEEVASPRLVHRFMAYRRELEQRGAPCEIEVAFHGSRGSRVDSILAHGLAQPCDQPEEGRLFYQNEWWDPLPRGTSPLGSGIYVTPMMSQAFMASHREWNDVLVVAVLRGRPFDVPQNHNGAWIGRTCEVGFDTHQHEARTEVRCVAMRRWAELRASSSAESSDSSQTHHSPCPLSPILLLLLFSACPGLVRSSHRFSSRLLPRVVPLLFCRGGAHLPRVREAGCPREERKQIERRRPIQPAACTTSMHCT